MKRHDDIKLSPSREVDKTATREEIDTYFARLKQLREEHKYSAANIYNFDETMLDFSAPKPKVVVPSSAKYGVIEAKELDFHITLGLCISADGKHVCPLLILPLKNFPQDLNEYAGCYCWSGQTSGWMTKEIFEQYIDRVFVPHVQSKRKENERVLLVLDGHSSRSNDKLMERLKAHRIDVLVLPAHSSHILQPLDLTVNGEFKKALTRKRHDMSFENRPKLRQSLLKSTKFALHMALFEDTVMSGFARSGIEPLSPGPVDKNPCTPAALPATNSTEVKENKAETSTKRFSISNKLLTSDEAIAQLKNQRLLAEEKKNKEKHKGKNTREGKLAEKEENEDDTDGENEQEEQPRASPAARRAKKRSRKASGDPQAATAHIDAPTVEPEASRPKRAKTGRFQSVYRRLTFSTNPGITADDFVDDVDDEHLAMLFASVPTDGQGTTTPVVDTGLPQSQPEPSKSPQTTASTPITPSDAVSSSSTTICLSSIPIDDLTVGSTPAAPSSRRAPAMRSSRRRASLASTPSQMHGTSIPAMFATPAPTAGHFLPGGAAPLAVSLAVTA